MKVAITGGSGFVGTKLAKKLSSGGHEVLVLDLRPPRESISKVSFIKTDLVNDLPISEFLSCDAVMHLAGVNIFGRWTKDYKKLILDSRVKTASAMISAVKNADKGPKVFISASAIGFYGEGGESELTESSPNGSDFLAKVCKEWEAVAKTAEEAGMRFVSVRTGIVLGKGGGMLAKLVPVFRWCLGGPMGSGRQWFSWIFMDDLLSVYEKALLDDGLSGPVNAVAPNPIRNKDMVKALGKALHRPAFIPVPGFVLRIVLGEFADSILMSQRVIPEKLLNKNFNFICPKIEQALKNIK